MNLVLALVLLTAVALFAFSIRRVPEGQAWTVHRFGRYRRTLQPGRHALWPLLDRIGHHVALTGHHLELQASGLGAERASADLYYQILDPLPTGDGLETVDAMVRRHADEILASIAVDTPAPGAPGFAEALKSELNGRLGEKGLRVVRCALHASA